MTSSHRTGRAAVAVAFAALFAFALVINLWNNDFPLGYHADEGKKITFVQTGTQDFQHPVLMLQVVRAVNTLVGADDPERLAVVARTTTALFGALLVLAACLVVRRSFETPHLWLYGFAVASSPILVVHAHYLKEDILFTCFAMATLVALLRFARAPGWKNAVLLGIGFGLALSSQYKGVLLVPLLLLGPLLVRCGNKGRYARWFPLCLPVALGVFALVNYPLFQDQDIFHGGLGFEIQHALKGHDVVVRPLDFWFGFHLTQSIIPGITLLLTLPALGYMVVTLLGWRRAADEDRLLLAYSLLFYCAVELSPLKPFPDYMRYVIPIVPALLAFSVKGIRWALLRAVRQRRGVQLGLLAAVLLFPCYDSVQLVRNLETDTREAAARWVEERNASARFESYAAAVRDVKYAPNGLHPPLPNYLVCSSFMYDRFFLGASLGGQSQRADRRHQQYQFLFLLPYHEIAPAYKSFAFSNPTIRIVDVSSVRVNTRGGTARGTTGSSGPGVSRPPPARPQPGRP